MPADGFDAREQTIRVRRWPSETPLFVAVLIVSLALWALLLLGSLGLILLYVVVIAIVLFFVQLVFVAHLRGSAILAGPDQFPGIHARVVELAGKAGLRKVPRTYILQADGVLNAMATKLFRGEYVVLHTDLLEACGDDTVARDMIIGHEIGHLRSGHLNWFILTAPGRFIPFLGPAYSRAREYTCDRWGAALCGDGDGARRGLLVLAGGKALARDIDVDAYIRQQADLDTGWMTIARWLSAYPPLSARVDALSPERGAIHRSAKGPLRAIAIMLAIVGLAIGTPFAVMGAIPYVPALAGLVGERMGVDGGAGGSATQAATGDAELDGFITACRAGDMQACDDLYYAAPVGSDEEEFGNSCGGRVPGNTELCTKLEL